MKRQTTCQRPGAANELKLFRRSIRLLPALARRGVAPVHALAVAYNATFLFYNMKRPPFVFFPRQILSRFSLSQIANFCEDIIARGDTESGFNISFREDLP